MAETTHFDAIVVGSGVSGGWAAKELTERGLWDSRAELPSSVVEEFGRRVEQVAAPIDDVRGTADYRRHAVAVMARRALTWAWNDYRRAA